MKCLQCDAEIPATFFSQKAGSEEFKGGRFSCPICNAEHVRREVGELPSGEPLYDFRLWGHLSTAKRKPSSSAAQGGERRKSPRPKPWR